MIKKKSWEQFRNCGMLWFINMILNLFGWAIVFEMKNRKEVTDVFPARVKYRGFSEKSNTEGYIRVSKYLKKHIKELTKEAKDK